MNTIDTEHRDDLKECANYHRWVITQEMIVRKMSDYPDRPNEKEKTHERWAELLEKLAEEK